MERKEPTQAELDAAAARRKEGEAKAAAALKTMLSKPNGTSQLYAVIKALTAMKMQKEDATPAVVVSSVDGKLTLKNSDYYAFLYQGSIGAAYNKEKL